MALHQVEHCPYNCTCLKCFGWPQPPHWITAPSLRPYSYSKHSVNDMSQWQHHCSDARNISKFKAGALMFDLWRPLYFFGLLFVVAALQLRGTCRLQGVCQSVNMCNKTKACSVDGVLLYIPLSQSQLGQ